MTSELMPTPTFFALHEGCGVSSLDRIGIIRAACGRANIHFQALDSLAVDYTHLPNLQPGDMLFNCTRGSTHLETLLTQPHTATFRTSSSTIIANGHDTTIYSALLQKMGLPAPKTIFRLPPDNTELAACSEWLGGFPIVIKIVGGTLGIGTMIIESLRSLRSVLDFLRTTDAEFILRQFISPKHVARLLVLGDEAIASLKYAIHPDDFRGLAFRDGGQQMKFGNEVEALAIAAASACEYEFTGVDIIIDDTDRPFILEVNGPSNFVAYEREMGIPIGDRIVAHLLRKGRLLANKYL